MTKIKKPIDYSRIKDTIASRFFNLIFNFYIAIGIFALFFVVVMEIAWAMGIVPYRDFIFPVSIYITIGIEVVFYGIAIYWRITKYREVPKGWTADMVREKWRLDKLSKPVPDRFSRMYWVGFAVVVGVLEVVGCKTGNATLVMMPYGLTFGALFIYFTIVLLRRGLTASEEEKGKFRNEVEMLRSAWKAQRQESWKKDGNKVIGLLGGIVVFLEIVLFAGSGAGWGGILLVSITGLVFVGVIVARKVTRWYHVRGMSLKDRVRDEYYK